MTDNNHDQDDFDPSLEEGGEDFGYEEESFGDEEFSDEPWDENFEDGGDETGEDNKDAPAPKKKGGLFNIILITAAVLGGGAFIYLKVLAPSGSAVPQPTPIAESPAAAAPETQMAAQMESPPASAPAEPPAPSLPEAVMPAPATPDVAPPDLTPPQPAASSDGLLPTLTPEPTSVPAPEAVPALAETPPAEMTPPAPVAPEPQQPVEVASAPPMPAPPVPTPLAAPESALKADNDFNPGLPTAKDIMLASPASSGADTAPTGGISAEAAKGIEQKLSVLLARLDTFESRITNLESGVHQVSSKIATLESRPAPEADLVGVNKALQALERKVSGLEKAEVAAPAASSAETPDVSKIDKPTFVPAAPEAAAETAAAPADIPETEAVPKPAAKAEPAVTAARNVSWVLRSAQPGAAMVAPKAGGDMRTVRVGDTLSGLGRIIAIEQRGSRWVVQGTQGTLTH